MQRLRQAYQGYFSASVVAIALHVLLLAILLLAVKPPPIIGAGDQAKIKAPIRAIAVDSRVVNQQLQAIARQKQRKKQLEIARQRRIKEAAERKARAERQAKLARIAAAKRKEAQELAQKKAAALKQQQALKRQKLLKAQAKRQQEAEIKKALSKESAQLAAARARHMQRVVSHYKGLMLQAINAHWFPSGEGLSLTTKLRIVLSASGRISSINLLASSGNPAFDQGVRVALYRAEPLPVPPEAKVFKQYFHTFNLVVSRKANGDGLSFQ